MAKGETKETYKDTRKRQQDIGKEQSQFRDDSSNIAEHHNKNAAAGRADLHGRYSSLADGGTYDPINFERLGRGVGGGRSAQNVNYNAIDDPERIKYNASATGKGAYEELARTGGYNSARRASIMDNVAGLKEFGRTGGLDDEAIGRFRGSGVFDEFARTGGYSDADQANIRARALSPIGSYATGTQDELNRRRSVQGGFAPGFDSASQSLRRGAARGIVDASLGAELGIKERVNAGRMGGARALSQAEGNLQGLRTGNMFAGMTGAGGMEMSMQNAINSGRLSGAGGLHQMSLADMEAQGFNASNLQQANMFNTANQMQADRFNASQRSAAQGANAAAARGNAIYNSRGQFAADSANRDFDWNTRQYGMGGLQGIQNADIGQAQAERDRMMGSYGMQYGAQNQAGNTQADLAKQPGWGGNVMNLVGSAAGVGAAYAGGRGGGGSDGGGGGGNAARGPSFNAPGTSGSPVYRPGVGGPAPVTPTGGWQTNPNNRPWRA